jgi:hypothetical protein
MAMPGRVAGIFRVGKSRPARGARLARKSGLNRVEQRGGLGALVLGRGTEGNSRSRDSCGGRASMLRRE